MPPQTFGKRSPLILTNEHLQRMFAAVCSGVEEAVPENKWDIVLDKFDELCDELEMDHSTVQIPLLSDLGSSQYPEPLTYPDLPSFFRRAHHR